MAGNKLGFCGATPLGVMALGGVLALAQTATSIMGGFVPGVVKLQ